MDDIDDPEMEGLLFQLKNGLERKRSMIASNEDISGTHESLDGEWGEWMCSECGIFHKEHRRKCRRCGAPRI